MPWTPERTITTASGELQLCALESIEEMPPLVELQRQIWGYGLPDTDYPYPARALFALSESGGLVAAARFKDQTVGFALAWLGMDRSTGRRYLHSQLVGILPAYRHLSIGYHLKIYQRDYALARDLDLVKWTFDPLQSANANLNLRKLGAIVTAYHPHYYGALQSYFSHGIATDRVWADWHIQSPRVCHRLDSGPLALPGKLHRAQITQVEEVTLGDRTWKKLAGFRLDLSDPELLMEIPDDFALMREHEVDLASEWQERVRRIFQDYLGRGYIASDFFILAGVVRRGFYLFARKSIDEVLAKEPVTL